MAVHEITIARSGAGKTYFRGAYYLVVEWLPFLHNRVFYTNLPLYTDAIIAYLQTYHPDLCTRPAVDRIHLFSDDVTRAWLDESSGPWDYFKDRDLSGGRIVIDEVHNYVHTRSSPDYVQQWRQWLGELRHAGCTFEAISQYETKIHPLIRHEAGLIRRLTAADDIRDKLFWVRWYDHFQLIAKARGHWRSRIWYAEFTEENGKWTKTGGGSVPLVPTFYKLYNSYSAPIAGGAKGARYSPHPFAQMTWPDLLAWYLSRNGLRILLASCFYVLVAWLLVFGGIASIFASAIRTQTGKPGTSTTTDTTSSTTTTGQPGTTDKPHEQPPPAPVAALWSPRGIFDASGKPYVSRATLAPAAPPPLLRAPAVAAPPERVQRQQPSNRPTP